jgi:hypothetical protein
MDNVKLAKELVALASQLAKADPSTPQDMEENKAHLAEGREHGQFLLKELRKDMARYPLEVFVYALASFMDTWATELGQSRNNPQGPIMRKLSNSIWVAVEELENRGGQ